jgi:hypothetical protein
MVKKFNISEAAADILAGTAYKRTGDQVFGGGKKFAADEQGREDIGHTPQKTTAPLPAYTKGVPSATAPGATPPVGQQSDGVGATKATGPQDSQGRSDLVHPPKLDQTSDDDIRDRKKYSAPGATQQPNKGAIAPYVPEETESDDEVISEDEEELEEVEEAAKWRQGYSASGHPSGYKHKSGEIGPLGGTFTNRPSGYDGDTKKVPVQKYRDKKDELSGRADTKLGSRGQPLLPKNAQSNLKHAVKQSLGKHGPAGKLPEEVEEEMESMAHEKKEKMKMKMKEDIDAMFEGEELTEDFKSKASTIYEASVLAHAKQIAEEVEVKLTEQFESALEEIKEDFADKIDDYLNYMVEEWMKENELAIEKGLRSEIVEDFIGGLRDLFAEHYIDIPTEKVDLVGELAEQVESLEDKLNEEIQRGVQLRKELVEHKKVEAVHSVCEGLLLTQAEKLKELAEGVEFSSEEEFVDKLIVMKESYFPSVVKSAESSALDEILIEEVGKKPSAVSHDPSIDAYAKAISKSIQR